MKLRLLLSIVVAFMVLFVASIAGAAARLELPEKAVIGQAMLGKVVSDAPLADVVVSWNGRSMRVPAERAGKGYEAVFLLGSDVKSTKAGPRTAVVSATSGGEAFTATKAVRLVPHKYPEERLTLPESMVTPPKAELERITVEARRTREALATVSARRYWNMPLSRPVPGSVSTPYGFRRVLNGKPKSPHRGLDFRGAAGTPVGAVAAGRVILVDDLYYTGNTVFVDHGLGVVSCYFHLTRAEVTPGQDVAAGQAVGLLGSTGRSTGPHLHLSLAILGEFVDPAPLIGALQE